MKDLVVLVADKDMEQAVIGLLDRPQSLGIREIAYDIFIHPEHDPGVFLRGADLLRTLTEEYAYALALFDREGCGREERSAAELEADLRGRLENAGWQNCCEVVALEPELEAWVFSKSPIVCQIIAALSNAPRNAQGKPERPKELMEQILCRAHIPRSSALYRQLADRVSLKNCLDPSFNRLQQILQGWFP